METITAFKAFNGRIFETEEKCLAYEKKMSQYPKLRVKRETLIEGKLDSVCVTYQEKPSSQIHTQKYYDIVGTGFRVYTDHILPIDDLENKPMWQMYSDFVVLGHIIKNGTFNHTIAESCCKEYNKLHENDGSNFKSKMHHYCVEDKYWVLMDNKTAVGCLGSCIGLSHILKVDENENEIDIFNRKYEVNFDKNLILSEV